ncbi:hypothetical protein [Actinokineospora inagensis]|uniref:hypothetical protein n=1 Tax=Actinokineospora inagensis TaxID=103730 RepID=UPI00041225DA|nr:hypothetical protein [Actinokineospora inagensis]
MDCADIAACAAALLTGDPHPGAVPTLTGRPARTFDDFLCDNVAVIRRSWAGM